MRKSEVKKPFGATVRAWRKHLGVSQEELAERADLHRTYISDVERGARNVSLESIEKLAGALEVPIGVLFAEADASSSRKQGALRSSNPGECVDILLVEDNPNDVELTLEAFRAARMKNRIFTVRDGVEAMEFLFGEGAHAQRRGTQRPLIVLLDLNLPKMNGLEVLRVLKGDDRTREIPVVVLTASSEDRDVAECRRLGATYYIVKPVNIPSLSKVTPQMNLDWALLKS
jgi:CheY-like chemotaxis protein/DNA-binding XRE family transcriptional regulator